MTAPALIMLIVSILMIWGGMGLALINLNRHPEFEDSQPTTYGNEE